MTPRNPSASWPELAAKVAGFDHMQTSLETIKAVCRAHQSAGDSRKALAVILGLTEQALAKTDRLTRAQTTLETKGGRA